MGSAKKRNGNERRACKLKVHCTNESVLKNIALPVKLSEECNAVFINPGNTFPCGAKRTTGRAACSAVNLNILNIVSVPTGLIMLDLTDGSALPITEYTARVVVMSVLCDVCPDGWIKQEGSPDKHLLAFAK